MAPENADHSPGDAARIPVVEERARLDKRDVVTGRVQVRIRNEQHTQRLQADLRSEAVEVERVAIGRELAAGETPPVPREEEDGTFVVPILEEVLVVEKRWVLKEEVRLHRINRTQPVEEPVTVLRQHAEVERLPSADS